MNTTTQSIIVTYWIHNVSGVATCHSRTFMDRGDAEAFAAEVAPMQWVTDVKLVTR